MSKIKWSYDRHGNPFEVKIPDQHDSQEQKDAFYLLTELRGVFNSKEEVENYIRIQNTPDVIGVNTDGTPQYRYR